MRRKANTRSSLFLMELIIAILFFSLASAVCLRMFAKSHELSMGASALNHAVNEASDLAESLRYDLVHGSDLASLDLVYYYDENWNEWEGEDADAAYVMTADLHASSGVLVDGSVTVSTMDGTVIYELPLTVYVGREAS